jgi:hypothetical protein
MGAAAPVLDPVLLPDEPWREQALTWIGSLLDRAILTGMRLAFEAAVRPTENDLPHVRTSAAPYLVEHLQRDPRSFFSFLDEPPAAAALVSEPGSALPGGAIVCRRFETRYEAYHCDPARASCVENDVVAVQHWMHADRSAPATVLALHGFTMGQPRIDAHILMAARWFALGLDVALLTLPYHGARSPRTARYSGELFGSWDVGRLNEAVRQAVCDVQLVRSWLMHETGRPVGLLGLSLGGYLAALCAGLMADLPFVIAVVPPVTLWDLPARLFGVDFDHLPVPFDDLERAYRLHSPLTYPLAIGRERALVVGGRGDLVVPPEHAHALWRHWGEPAIWWFSGSHSAPFRRGEIMARAAAHVGGLGLLP